ncbi:hypothetical protein LTR37_003295 [Vermiconidia calcicola]|uniref:Uncharacterized protein n=1 Tax=Vermiconidia calcicola TaxID=1690605 RepID=A0ACC3NPW2_9PEZI|nr:hypothetical protein LTR37_003295 [Vermiconidia calcicola]
MSSPPSPPGPPQEFPPSTLSGAASSAASSTAAAVSLAPGFSDPRPVASFVPPQYYAGYVPYPPPPFSVPTGPTHGPSASALGIAQHRPPATTPPLTVTSGTSEVGLATTRTGRKSKAHVASACINCKRAHLSCDVQRPCARCVASGKQDTCYDVQHKKRGRPRLREEGESTAQRMMPEQSPRAEVFPTAGPSSSRSLAGTRHRRTESLRSLRSQASDASSGSTLPTPGFASHLAMQPPPSTQQQRPPSSGLSPAETPTAYLDLDFVLIRANRPFLEIMCGGQDVRERHLQEIAAPADGETFQTIRNRLRAEREAREPAYMPPILQTGQDPLHGVSEADVDRLSQTFADQTYTWTRRQLGARNETFPVRIRLAKAAIYFVAVTLPSFRPMVPQRPRSPQVAQFAVPAPLRMPEGSQSQRVSTVHSGPPTPHYSFSIPGGGRPPEYAPIMPSYPQPNPGMQYPPYHTYQPLQQPPFSTTQRLPVAEPPTDTTPFTPRSAPRTVERPPGATVQLPPLARTSAPRPGPSRSSPAEVSPQQAVSSEEEDDEGQRLRSPRKRRRVGIHDVLQR